MSYSVKVIKRLSSLGLVTICFSLMMASAALAAMPQISLFQKAFYAEAAEVKLRDAAERSEILDKNNKLVGYLSEEENREEIELSEVPPDVVAAILAVEDSQFYSHNGLYLKGTLRAAIQNILAGGIEQGGSTITQQLIKNAVLTSEQTAQRKTTEAFLALRLEKQMSKDEILKNYLNTVYFGSGAYGVQAAAETYWGYANASELTACDGALLAGMIRNPTLYDPTRFNEEAKIRRDVVISRLVSVGEMTKDEAKSCQDAPLPVERKQPVDIKPTNYFTEEVLQILLKDETILGGTQEDRFDMIYTQGLKVYTTMDTKAQQYAEEAQNHFVPENPAGFTASIVSLDTHTGAVRALVGGPGFKKEKFNIATQGKQQPGSTMKPFVLAALFEQGYVPTDTVRADSPCSFTTPEGTNYTVKGGGAGGRQTIASVTRSSYNCAFVRLGQVAGNDNIIDITKKLGMTTIPEEAKNYLSLPLGSQDLIPIEVAGAYSAFANDGELNKPWLISKVESSTGEILYEHEQNFTRPISKNTARMIAEILRQNVTLEKGNGTGRRAQVVLEDGTELIVAGKTGTTNRNVSAWFAGFTDQLTTVVWVGHPDGNIPIRPSSLNTAAYNVPEYCCLSEPQGGTAAAPIFDFYMEKVLVGAKPVAFKQANESASRSSKYLQVEGEAEVTNSYPYCPGAKPGVRNGLPVDSDGDGSLDCLISNNAPPGNEDTQPNSSPDTKPKPTPQPTPKPKPTPPPETDIPITDPTDPTFGTITNVPNQ